MVTTIAFVHTLTTLGMALVIWDVQLRRYPSFFAVSPARFSAFHRDHVARISVLVVPLMLGELASSIALVMVGAATSLHEWERWLGVMLVAGAWASTFFVQVPLHDRLSRGYDERAICLLVRTNWVRTALWSLRALLVVGALAR